MIITLCKSDYAAVFTLDEAPFICCYATEEILGPHDFTTIQLGVSSTQPDTNHWIQLDAIDSANFDNGYITVLSCSPSCEHYVSQRKRISAYTALRQLLTISPHPIYFPSFPGDNAQNTQKQHTHKHMTISSQSINITIDYTDSEGSHALALTLVSDDQQTFTSEFSALPESVFSREFKEAYNSAMRELSGHYPHFTFLNI